MCVLEKKSMYNVHIILRLINFKSQLPTSYQYQKINQNSTFWLNGQSKVDSFLGTATVTGVVESGIQGVNPQFLTDMEVKYFP